MQYKITNKMVKLCAEVKEMLGNNSPLTQCIVIVCFIISIVIFAMILTIFLNNPITPMQIAFLTVCSLMLYILLVATIHILYSRCCYRNNDETVVVSTVLPRNERQTRSSSQTRSVNQSVARSVSHNQQEDIETGNVRGTNPLRNP
jgi:hypothetical protein